MILKDGRAKVALATTDDFRNCLLEFFTGNGNLFVQFKI
jgi:hypothetical protein